MDSEFNEGESFRKVKMKNLKYHIEGNEVKGMGRELAFWWLVFPYAIILIAMILSLANPIDNWPYTGYLLIFFACALIAGIKLFKSIL